MTHADSTFPSYCPPWLPPWIWGRLHERQLSPWRPEISVIELEQSLRAENGGAVMPEELPDERPSWLPEPVWAKLQIIKRAYASTVLLD